MTQVVDSTMSREQLEAWVAKLQAENTRLKTNTKSNIKVSSKGAVSVYGMGRFPVTLYGSQWQKLAGMLPEVMAFVEANKAQLSWKDEE